MNEREIFLAALHIKDFESRDSFLDSICESDDSLRQRINKLINAHQLPQHSLDRIAGIIAAEAIEANVEETDITEPGTLANEPTIAVGTQMDQYQILKRVGYGGMGEVYLAHDTKLDRKVAIKLVAPGRNRDSAWLQQFRREARAVGSLNHPNILTIHEIGESGGVPYLATEFIDGLTMRQILAEGRPSVSDAIDYAIQLAGAFVTAHAANIIHRDLKPENLMVRADGLLKVLDFGLAKRIVALGKSPQETGLPASSSKYQSDPGIVIGTIRFMSPEQALGKELDTRTDIFSMGIVLYELFTGALPFQGDTTSDVLAAILHAEPKPMRQIAPEIGADVERIVFKCLRKDRGLRYQSAYNLLTDLKKIVIENKSNPAVTPKIRTGGGSLSSEMSTKLTPPDLAPSWDSEEIPAVRYALSGDVNIAYQVLGKGTIDLVFVMGWVSHLEMFWKEPLFARFLRRLAKFSRLILFDKRGTGLSDKVPLEQLPTLEQRMDDVRAVMDSVGSQKAVLCGISEGGPMCTLFAATYPEKTIALAMIGSYARRLWASDYPWGPTDEHRQHFLEEMRRDWGGPVGIEDRAPSKANDPQFRNWWATYLRMGASPGAALALTQMNAQIDIRPILPTVQVPTLVIHRTNDRCLMVEEGRYLANQIPGAKFVELPGNDHLPFVGDQDAILDEIEVFLTGVRHTTLVDRVLTTVLSIYFELQSGAPPSKDSDSKTEKLFQSHVVRETELFKGRIVSFERDAVLVTFDGPARAVRAGIAISETALRLGFTLKAGVHTGECDLVDEQYSGAAIDQAKFTARLAPENEILATNTVKDLVVGSGLRFDPFICCELPNDLDQQSMYRIVR